MDEAEGPSSDPMLDDGFEVPDTPTGECRATPASAAVAGLIWQEVAPDLR